MNKKIASILILFTLLSTFIVCKHFSHSKKLYKIIKVVEADEFCIDVNKNNKIDEDELYKLADIVAFRPIKNKNTIEHAKNLGINIKDYIEDGYLARNWAQDELTGKYVEFLSEPVLYAKNLKYKKVHLSLNNENLALKLLKNGLAVIDSDTDNKEFLFINSLNQVKNNIKEISKIDFYIVNSNTNIVHTINDEHFEKLTNAFLILKKHVKSYIPCKICFKKVHFNINISEFNIPKSKYKYKDSIYRKFSNLEIFFINPLVYKKPNYSCNTKVCKSLLNEINSANESIDVALYGFGDQKEIYNALLKAKNRGVKIRSVMDYSKKMDEIYPYTQKFVAEFNPILDKNEVLMHNKFFIFDSKAVFTGSVNVSETGTGGYNSNIALILRDSNIVKAYQDEFNQMYSGKFSKRKSEIEIQESTNNNYSIKSYFLPKSDVYESEIKPLIKNAKKDIYISVFYLTSKELVDELIQAKRRKVNILVLVDALSSTNFRDRIISLRKAHIPVKIEDWGGKNHEKTIMVDSETLVVGSANFSKSGFYKNDENVVVIKSKKIAELYKDYYLYLFNSVNDKFFYSFLRAESFESKNSCYDGIDNNFDGKIDKNDEGCMKK